MVVSSQNRHKQRQDIHENGAKLKVSGKKHKHPPLILRFTPSSMYANVAMAARSTVTNDS